MTPVQIAAMAIVLVACVIDVRSRRIPNALTFGAAVMAFAFHAWTGGLGGFLTSAAGWTVGAALFFPFFALRGMGAGDVKLIAAVGAWLGPVMAFWVAMFTSVAGGVLGLLVALFHGHAGTALRNILTLIGYWRLVGVRPLAELTLDHGRGPRLAYAVPVAIGTMVTLWLK
jgi:prepilin peptidase CpaA